MIDIKTLKQLIKLMKENELTEIDLRDKDEQVSLKRGPQGEIQPVTFAAPPQPIPAATAPPQTAAAAPAAADAPAPAADAASEDDGLVPITSPMVGTFYSSSSPEAEAYVKVGDPVDADTVVCILEAMKVFNEIKAETSGTIARLLVNNGEAVEFGQPLFLVKPN